MNIDQIIVDALKSGEKIVSGGFMLVEGNPELNQLHINYVDKACFQNLTDFINGKNRGWILLGILPTHEGAQDFCSLIRQYIKNPEGVVLI